MHSLRRRGLDALLTRLHGAPAVPTQPLQGEAIEEAVRRETREEAGVELVAVDIVGSQPWPVGEWDARMHFMLSVVGHAMRKWICMHGMACLQLQAQCSWPHAIMSNASRNGVP